LKNQFNPLIDVIYLTSLSKNIKLKGAKVITQIKVLEVRLKIRCLEMERDLTCPPNLTKWFLLPFRGEGL